MKNLFDEKEFVTPGKEYRGIPFWSWNCKVTKEKIDKQLDVFCRMGFGGVDIHPRVGLDIEYLGDEYMELVEYTIQGCKKRGLKCWLYDDDRYPSGAADGFATKDVRYRDRGLFLTCVPQDGYCKNRDEFEKLAGSSNVNKKGYFAAAYALKFADGILKEYKRFDSMEEVDVMFFGSNTRIRYAYVRLAAESDAFEGQTYIDTLNQKAMDEFIRITHERYYQKCGNEFGNGAQAIFTDEPRIGKQAQIESASSNENFEIPYSEAFENFAYGKYHFSMLDVVPELVWDLPDNGSFKSRYVYRDALAECFTEAYMDNICAWCRQHNILMTGHILSETPLIGQATTAGDGMRSYRNMDIPGVDMLCNMYEYVTVKQAASVSKQQGRQDMMSELYGVTNWDCTFKTYKQQGDWQTALGVTIRVPHLSFMSMAGEAKRDWPASIFSQSPWFEEYPYIEDYFARIHYALKSGIPVTHVAILHPVESIWLHMGQADKNTLAVERIQEDFANITNTVLLGTIDADFISESLLPKQCGEITEELQVGKMKYTTIIVPSMYTIRGTTVEILKKFRKAGGRVIFGGVIPEYVDAKKSGEPEIFAAKCEKYDFSNEEIGNLLQNKDIFEKEREIKVTVDGKMSDNILYQLRCDDEGEWLFLCNARDLDSDEKCYDIEIRNERTVTEYDAINGNVKKAEYCNRNGKTYLSWLAAGQDSILFRLDKADGNIADGMQHGDSSDRKYLPETEVCHPDTVRMAEKNMLLLDYLRYSVDNGKMSERMETLKADRAIRTELGFQQREEHMRQPWATDEGISHNLKLYYEFYSETEIDAELAFEKPCGCQVIFNGVPIDSTVAGYYVDEDIRVIKLPGIKSGRNELVLELQFNQKTNIENMYLLGEFDVDIVDRKPVLKAHVDKLQFGDITGLGMPFYTGNIDYTFKVQVSCDGEYYIRIPEFSAPLLAVFADGVKTDLIAYKPHRGKLGQLAKGEHTVTVRMYGNRYNGFGMLHNANPDFMWKGPKAYRTEGTEWTDAYMLHTVGIISKPIIERCVF